MREGRRKNGSWSSRKSCSVQNLVRSHQFTHSLHTNEEQASSTSVTLVTIGSTRRATARMSTTSWSVLSSASQSTIRPRYLHHSLDSCSRSSQPLRLGKAEPVFHGAIYGVRRYKTFPSSHLTSPMFFDKHKQIRRLWPDSTSRYHFGRMGRASMSLYVQEAQQERSHLQT